MDKIFYKRIRQCLELTQDDVAKMCNVSKKTVARFESGTSKNSKLDEWYSKASEQLVLNMDK